MICETLISEILKYVLLHVHGTRHMCEQVPGSSRVLRDHMKHRDLREDNVHSPKPHLQIFASASALYILQTESA